jgi:hypothetical protein
VKLLAEQQIPRLEKRRETRYPADGPVQVIVSDYTRLEVEGRLVDVSQSGFRMAHQCRWLATASEVEFRHGEVTGRARVMWNRVLPDRIESGFLVL